MLCNLDTLVVLLSDFSKSRFIYMQNILHTEIFDCSVSSHTWAGWWPFIHVHHLIFQNLYILQCHLIYFEVFAQYFRKQAMWLSYLPILFLLVSWDLSSAYWETLENGMLSMHVKIVLIPSLTWIYIPCQHSCDWTLEWTGFSLLWCK